MIKPFELYEIASVVAEICDMGLVELRYTVLGLEGLGRSLDAITLGELGEILDQARDQAIKELMEGRR